MDKISWNTVVPEEASGYTTEHTIEISEEPLLKIPKSSVSLVIFILNQNENLPKWR